MALFDKVVKTNQRFLILEKARQLLLKSGYTQLSIRSLAGLVGCSVGTIYTYFENKDVLIHSLIEEGFDKMIESQLEIEALVEDPVERLKALCRNYIRFGLNNPEYYEIMYHLSAERMARFPAEKYRRARRSLEVLARSLEQCTAENKMNVKDPYLGANTIWSMLHGLVTLIQFKRIDKKIDQNVIIEGMIAQAVSLNGV